MASSFVTRGAAAPAAASNGIVTHKNIELIVALLLLSTVAFISFFSWEQYARFADSTRHSNEALSDLSQLVQGIRDAESSQRGFLLTRDDQYLAEYQSSIETVRLDLQRLAAMPPDVSHPQLLSQLRSATEQKLRELASTVDLATHGHADRALAIVATNHGLSLMTNISALDSAFEERLRNLLRRNRDHARSYARLSQYIATVGCAAIFVLVAFANRRIKRLLAASAQLNKQLTGVNADLQQFVYSASHDLQEPLRTLAIHAELAMKKARESRPFETELIIVNQAAKLMANIVDDLLTYTQAVSDSLPAETHSDLNAVMRKVRDGLRTSIEESKAGIACSGVTALPLSEPHAYILLQNLLSNALKYRQASKAPLIRIHSRYEYASWILLVSDNGIGIKPEHQQQIFGLFKRLHSRQQYPGTGLGLAICKKIVERYSGTISVESQEEQGSTFKVAIPAQRRPASPRAS